ncbi:MAG: hypothetical protein WDN28_14230 [Chthoniobacter sp.]
MLPEMVGESLAAHAETLIAIIRHNCNNDLTEVFGDEHKME